MTTIIEKGNTVMITANQRTTGVDGVVRAVEEFRQRGYDVEGFAGTEENVYVLLTKAIRSPERVRGI